jgi:hypothetical protein
VAEDTLKRITLTLCAECVRGTGGECHTPGCALWMSKAPDVPIIDYDEAPPTRTYLVMQPWDLDGEKQPAFHTTVEADSIEAAQAEAWQRFRAYVDQVSNPEEEPQ